MDVATDATVLGDFDDAVSPTTGVTSRFYRRDGRFFVETEGADGEPWPSSRSPTSSATTRCSST